jgi:hypothetical protein
MLRRILMVSGISVVTADLNRRAGFGIVASICSAVFVREMEPYNRRGLNSLALVASYVVMLNYGSALVINSELSEGISPLFLGIIFSAVNFTVVVMGLGLSYLRQRREEREVLRWKGVPLSTQKLEILKAVMEGTPIPNSGGPPPLEDLNSFGDIALSKNVSAAAPSLSQTSEVHQSQKTSGALRTLLPPNQMLDAAEVTARSICTMQSALPRSKKS